MEYKFALSYILTFQTGGLVSVFFSPHFFLKPQMSFLPFTLIISEPFQTQHEPLNPCSKTERNMTMSLELVCENMEKPFRPRQIHIKSRGLMRNVTNYQRNANQNHHEVSPLTSQNGHHQIVHKQ